MKIHVVDTMNEDFYFYATKKEAMKKIKQLQKESDQQDREYESWKQSRDEDDVIIATGGNKTVCVNNYYHISYDTYEFEPNKKGLIDAMKMGLGLVSGMSIGDTYE